LPGITDRTQAYRLAFEVGAVARRYGGNAFGMDEIPIREGLPAALYGATHSLSLFLKLAREHQGYSRDELAEKVGVHERSIRRIEGNESIPQNETLQKICDVLAADYETVRRMRPLAQENIKRRKKRK
jgi:DNA-binding XRE family transcriptional regulator